jgi:hypothetical protein
MSYITISFSTFEAKESFCEVLGIDTESRFAKGEELIEKLNL